MADVNVTTAARRIARAVNEAGQGLQGGVLVFDAEGRGGAWHGAGSRPDLGGGRVAVRVRGRITEAEAQRILDGREA